MSNWLATDGWKIILLGGSFVAIYALSRWASRQSELNSPPLPSEKEPAYVPLEAPRQSSVPRKIVPIDRGPQFHTSLAIDEDELRPIRIVQMYFSKFDFEPGPPDPSSFADELFVKLYNTDSGYDWMISYFVTTPNGINEMLQAEHWDYAFADRVFFVHRYDPKVIRQAVVEQLLSTLEKSSSPKEPEDRYV